MITYKQLSLADFFTDCQNKFDNDKYEFLSILDETINLDEIVPVSFISHFHAATGRPRKHLLYPMLKALLLQLIFSIPTTSLLIVFLKYSQELRDFCYAYKFGIVTNGLGIVREISFTIKAFWMLIQISLSAKKSDSPDEDKSLADSKALIPVLKDFF